MERSHKGFTLVELLVVIAVLAALIGLSFVWINPLKRIREGNDAKIRNDFDQIAIGLQSFFVIRRYYPTDPSVDLVNNSDLKSYPLAPSGNPYVYVRTDPACSIAPYLGCECALYATLQSPKVAGNVWCWRSVTGQASEVATCAP